MASAPVCRREFKFSVLLPAEEFCPGLEPGEEVLLQGVVDAWFETLEGITVVDFKSDQVSRSGAAARERSTALSWRRTAGPWRRSPENRCSERRSGSSNRGADPSVKGRQKGREKSQDNF